MSTRVFLKKDIVEGLAGFIPIGTTQMWQCISLGINIFRENGGGRYFFDLKDPSDFTISPRVMEANIIDMISCRTMIPNYPVTRETGVYHHESTGSAEAIVENALIDHDGGELLEVSITAREMDHLVKLLGMIKEGSIRPDIGYEDPQVGMSRKDLEEELTAVRANLSEAHRLTGELRQRLGKVKILLDQYSSLANELEADGWLLPWCWRKRIVARIRNILADQKK
jgi:hypothetical protein